MNLAIKGHKTRGKEVIEILEMLGGINVRRLEGTDHNSHYTIDSNGNISGALSAYLYKCNNHIYYTIEEFLEKYPHKVGDKVLVNGDVYTIKSMTWYIDLERVVYRIEDSDGIILMTNWYANEMMPYTEQIEETMEEGVYADNEINCYHQDFGDKVRIRLGGDYEIKVENKVTYIVKKQPQYPKTYEECCKVLGADPSRIIVLSNRKDIIHEENKHCFEMYNLYQLLICRDAYWKIAGEEMGLGKPWQPNYHEKSYEQGSPIKYVIYYTGTYITKEQKCTPSYILAFPTEEMRDAFLKNFEDLIEECKELL